MAARRVASPQAPPPGRARRPTAARPPTGPRPASRPARAGSGPEPSADELVKQLTEQTKVLVKQELRLAQVELQEKGKKVGIGAGLFGAGGLMGFFAAAALITATVLALSTALTGKKQIAQATPPAPEQAIGSVKRDVHTVKRRARR